MSKTAGSKSRLRRLFEFLTETKDGRPFREVFRERMLEASIPGRSNLHGPMIWLLPCIAASLVWGQTGLWISSVLSLLLWFFILPQFDNNCLQASTEHVVVNERPLRDVINRMGRQLALTYGLVIVPALVAVLLTQRVGWVMLGSMVLIVFAGEIVTYIVGELLWYKHLTVGTRLRVFDRNHALIDDAVEQHQTVQQFDEVVRFRLGDNYQRTYGWQRRSIGARR